MQILTKVHNETRKCHCVFVRAQAGELVKPLIVHEQYTVPILISNLYGNRVLISNLYGNRAIKIPLTALKQGI